MHTIILTQAQYEDLIYALHNLRALMSVAFTEALERGNTNDAEIMAEERGAANDLLEVIYHQEAHSAPMLPF